ncbi:MAG: single-stranded-DNA-specific exonuclease RecJ [Bacteroidales bacterium]|jgi:single-stranded-DNA-specific exonuclease|nr:single-stranded-DNA-specific exonuclease RecJ [Bacteroidales bacterium]
MEKRWVVKKRGDKELVEHLKRVLGIDEVIANLLVQRDINSFNEARSFFRPQIDHLHDPFLMKDMDRAVERITQALKNNEKILVYGDYDVDGTSAVALVYSFLRERYERLDYYIPDRYSEGYGISEIGIDYAYEHGFSLIISLDCGIKAVDKVNYANERNIDFIICDHHRPGEEIPQAYAVLDPKRTDCNYPYKELSGCGIGFKLIQGLMQSWEKESKKSLIKYLDLVTISIAADIVPITGENRILAHLGLNLLNSEPRPGILAIMEVCGIINTDTMVFTREMNINDLVFYIGPRINAAGRMESGRESVALLISGNFEIASMMATQINQYNTSRRNLDMQTTQEALDMINENEELKNSKSTIVYNPDWHKGVIGIVASRLTDYYYRPTIVFTRSNDTITGSARSVKDFDVYDAIDACSEYIEHFGGHKYAAGLSIIPDKFDSFCKCFGKVVSENITESMLIPEVEIDLTINLNQINSKFMRILKQFAPFGPGNMSPIFQTSGLIDTGNARVVGKNHLKFEVVHRETRGFPFSAIAFQQGQHINKILSGEPFSICYHVEENFWNGNVNLQLNVKDISFDNKSLG